MEQNTSCRMVARCWLPIIHPTRTRKLASSPAPCSLRFLKKRQELPISELAVLAFPDPHHRGESTRSGAEPPYHSSSQLRCYYFELELAIRVGIIDCANNNYFSSHEQSTAVDLNLPDYWC